MKYLLVIVLALVVYGMWRNNRRIEEADRAAQAQGSPASAAKTAALAAPTEIVACQVCDLHMPRAEALPGRGGFYCSAEHRQQAGG